MWRSFLTLGLLALVLGIILVSMGHQPFSGDPVEPDNPVSETDPEDLNPGVLTLSSEKPVVMDVSLDEAEKSQLREVTASELSLTTVRLTILDLTPDAAGARRSLRVYIDTPESEELTIDAPGYAGSFSFGHQNPAGPQSTSFVLDIAPTLRRLNDSGLLDLEKDYLRVMLVARPLDDAAEAESFRIAVSGATMTIVQ